MLITCEICGKTEEFVKKTVKVYAKWLEIEPEKYICRECEETHVWPNIIQFKLIDSYRSLKKTKPKEEESP
jgi:uncharacterized protein YlaI